MLHLASNNRAKNYRLTATGSGIAALVLAGLLLHSSDGAAQSTTTTFDTTKVLKGFQIAPVPLNMQGKDPNLVGYGSYLVNAVGDCNGCHNPDPSTEYLPGGTPFFNQHPTVVNPATYMGGGQDFGAFPDPAGPFPHIISRNLTPDSTGLPEGGNSLATFIQIMRTGLDTDHVHPTCTGAPNGNCIPAPFDGDLLQIMPWPTFQNMTDDDLTAIYTYLSTIPCLEGGPGEPANRCGSATAAKTAAVALPKNASSVNREVQLDGTQSMSADGKPLMYQWTVAPGSPQAGLSGTLTATPTVQFGIQRGVYAFQLTVTDSSGKSSTDIATVNFVGN
jgi:hypothetical protein